MAGLVEELEKIAAGGAAKQMQAVVNFVGLEPDAVKAFAKDKELKHVVFTAVDEQNAAKFAIAEKAEFTVMQYLDKTVAANHATAPGKPDAGVIEQIVQSSRKLLADAPVPAEKGAKPKKKKKQKKPKQKRQNES